MVVIGMKDESVHSSRHEEMLCVETGVDGLDGNRQQKMRGRQ